MAGGTKAVGWWTGGGGAWQARKQLTVTNHSAATLSANTTIAITIDTATLVAQNKLKSNCADLRVVYQPSSSTTTELTRHLVFPTTASGAGTCSTSYATKVYIPLQAAISASASSTDYYVYYKNGSASSPSSTDNAFDVSSIDALLVCPFDGTTTCAGGETPAVETGPIRYSGSKSAMNFDGFNDNINIGGSVGTFAARQPYTLEAWVNPSSYPAGSLYGIIYMTDNMRLAINGGSGVVEHRTSDGSITAGTALPLNTWSHVAAVFDGTTRYLFINGVLAASAAESSHTVAPGCGAIGSDYSSCNPAVPFRVLYGAIDEVRISSTARYTSAFTPQTAPFVRDAYTRMLMHLDENGDDPRSTTRAFDDSGSNYHGTIQNSPTYISGFVGVDNTTSATGTISRQSYAAHEGVMMELGTTNKVTNPSFENGTFDTNWTTNTNLTSVSNGSAPYYKFGSTSAKLTASASAISTNSNMFTTSINLGNTSDTMVTMFVYDGTSGNIGGTVSSSIAKVVFNGTAQTSTYTDVGGGWWRISYSGAAINGAAEYGIEIQPSKLVYVDAVQIEQIGTAYTTSYADGSLGVGYSWSGTANNSVSVRAPEQLGYASSGNISGSAGTISMWFKVPRAQFQGGSGQSFLLESSGDTVGCSFNNYSGVSTLGAVGCSIKQSNSTYRTVSATTAGVRDKWMHVLYTWSGSTITIYINGTSEGTNTLWDGTMGTVGNIQPGFYSTANNSYCECIISDFRIYDNALSGAQVTSLYNASLAGHSESYQIDAFNDTRGQNPVSIWHMDEATGSTLYDSTLQANHLTLGTGTSAPTWTVSTTGNNNPRNTSLKFDGSNDYASRTYDADFDVGTDSFSLSGWFKHAPTVSGQDTILARYTNAGYKVYMNSSGFICFGIDDDSTWGPDDSACSTTSYADNKWHTYTAVKTSTTSITLYIDGIQRGQDASLAATATLSSVITSLYIGIDSDFASNPWDGYLDEFYFYPYARSVAQAKVDASALLSGGVLGANTTDVLTNDLIAYWKIDEGTGTTTADASGNAITGTLGTGSSAPTWAGGRYGAGLSFDGNDYVDAGDISTVKGISKLTLSAWMKRTSAGSFVGLGKDAGTHDRFGIAQTTSGTILFTMHEGGLDRNGTVAINDTSWHLVTMVYDGTNSVMDGYVDGVKQSLTYSFTLPPTTTNTASSFIIGRYVDSGQTATSSFSDGKIDDVRIYSRALTPPEVEKLYNFSPPPVAYWKMDERSGTTSSDNSGNGYTSTFDTSAAKPAWTTGKYGGGVSFDGGDDMTASSSIDNTFTNQFSVSTWFKSSTIASDQDLIRNDAGNGDRGVGLLLRSSKLLGYTYNGAVRTIAGNTTLASNTWYYATVTYDGAALKVYLNGSVDGSLSTTGNVTLSSTSFVFGTYGGGAFLTGALDDTKIYDYPRTQKQIVEDMNAGHPAPGSPVGSQVAYWKFDEGQGTTAYNAGIGASGPNNVTLSTVASPATATSGWSNAGKYNKAVAFDGTDDYARTAIDLSGTNVITLSFWLNWTSYSAADDLAMEFSADSNGVATGFLVDPNESSSGKFVVGYLGAGGYNTTHFTRPSAGVWHHYAFVMDKGQPAATEITPYVDGVQVSYTKNYSNNTTNNFGNHNLYFMSRGGTSLFGPGIMDEVKIYNYALTSSEIKVDYNRGQSLVLGSMSDNSTYEKNAANQEYCVPGDSTSCAAPVGEWKMDERSGTSANDTSGNGYTATLGVGASAPAWASGKVGSSLLFDGVDDDMTASASIDDSITSAFTISTWFKTTNAGLAQTLFRNDDCLGNAGYTLAITSGGKLSAYGYIGGIKTITGSTTLSANTWYHGTFVYNGSNISLYLNGKSDATAVSASGNLTLSSTLMHFGNCHYSDPSFNQYFSGNLDNMRIYNYARSAAQVAWDYNRGGPVAQYKFDECNGGTANDASGNSNNGTLTIGATGSQTSNGTCGSGTSTEAWSNGASGKFNSSLKFDGTDDYVSVPDANMLDLTTDGSLSVWINPTNIADYRVIMEKGTNWAGARSYYGMYFATSKAVCSTANSSGQSAATSTVNISTSTWTHISCTWNGSLIKLYINGVLNATGGQTYPADTTTGTLYIGRAGVAGGYTDDFSGQIDDARVYNYPLTATQVKNLYNGGNSVYYGPASGQP